MTGAIGSLNIWTVYERPRDFPQNYVARRSVVYTGGKLVQTAEVRIAASLDEVRARLPPGLHCMPRDPKDDPVIVEVWI